MRLLRTTTALMAGLLLSGSVLANDPTYAGYQENVENPGIFAMVGDLVIARPLLAGITAIGATAFVVSLPFTALAGNTKEAGQELVVRPGRETFMRCLGCTKSGYGKKQQDENR
ncbi:MAG: multidrug transporter [Pseudomonas sp.]